MIRKYLILSIFLLTSFYSFADVKVYADPATIVAGQNGKVFIKVDGFVDVSSYQMTITWDPSKMTYVEVGDLDALNLVADTDFNLLQPGKLRAIWAHPSSDDADLAAGTTLFSVTFNGICGSQSLVDIIDDGFFTVQFTNKDGDAIPHSTQAGTVTVTGNPCGGAQTVLSANTIDAQSGEKTCVSIVAGSGFTSITGLTADINVSSGCAAFNEVTNFNANLNGLGVGSFNVSQAASGIIKLTWSAASPISAGAGTVLFDICYTANGSCCETTVPITFSNVTFTVSGGGTNNLAGNGGLNIKCGVVPDCDPEGLAMIASDHLCNLPNDVVTMDFTVQDFSDIAAMQFSIDWDPSCLELETDGVVIPSPNPITGLTAGKFSDPVNGCMIVLWDDATGGSITLPNGTIVFSLKFKVIGTLGTTCKVNIGSKCSGGLEFLNLAGDNIPLSTCSGDVEIKSCNQQLAIVDINVDDSPCAEPCTGAIEFSVTGGVNPVITWSQAGLNGSSVSGLCKGTYTVTVTSGASSVEKTYNIDGGNVINVSTASVTPATSGANGAIDINVSGGTGSFTYAWNTTPVATTQDVNNLAVGTYTVTITDSGGCSKTHIVSVTDGSTAFDATITALKFGEFDLSCSDACDGRLTAVVSGGSAPFTYQWSVANQTTQTAINICAGTHSVTITDSANKTVTKSYTILAPAEIVIDFDIIYPTAEDSNDGSIEANPLGGNLPFNYSWTGAVVSTLKELTNVGVGLYNVSVTDATGCTATGSETLTVGGKGCYQGIGAITPNGDGKNDRLLITCSSSVVNTFSVFNRWGEKVFDQAAYKNTWEGTNNQGENLPDGGYYWVLEVRESNGGTEIFRGSVSIIRTLR